MEKLPVVKKVQYHMFYKNGVKLYHRFKCKA